MTNVANLPVAQQQDASEIMEAVLLAGDLSKLSPQERTNFYMSTCRSLGLNPLTRPFDYIKLSGREVLYAKRDAADQLRKINRISLEIIDRKISGDLLVVAVRARTPDGRTDEDMGVVSVKGLAGEALCNAMLKATTKAKRRVTLSICGLGMLDESEVQSVLAAERVERGDAAPPPPPPPPAAPAAIAAAKPKPPIKVKVPGQPDVEFPQSDGLPAALKGALEFMSGAILDGGADVVGANAALLDRIAERLPEMAEAVADLRAAAAMAGELADDAALADDSTDDDDTFPGDRPSGTGSSLPPSIG